MAAGLGIWLSRTFKFLALAIGGPLAVLAAMALLGTFLENGWARLALSIVAVIIVPAVIADRLLPDDVGESGSRGIVTDVLAISWLGFAFVIFGAAIGATKGSIDVQAQRFEKADYPNLAKGTRWLGASKTKLGPAPTVAVTDSTSPADEKVADEKVAGEKVAGGQRFRNRERNIQTTGGQPGGQGDGTGGFVREMGAVGGDNHDRQRQRHWIHYRERRDLGHQPTRRQGIDIGIGQTQRWDLGQRCSIADQGREKGLGHSSNR